MAAASSLGGASVDQRLPTRRTSPLRSRSSSRASALSLFMPAARAAIAVENEPGSVGSTARRRSVRWSGWRCSGGAGGTGGSAVAGTGSDRCAGWRPRSGSSPKWARQLPHHERPGPARPGGRPQTDASHAPSGRRRTAARRFLSRSDLRYAAALSPYHRTSIAPSQLRLDSETLTAAGRRLQFGRRGDRGVHARNGGRSCPSRPECESARTRCPSSRARSRSSLRPTSKNTSRTAPANPSDMSTVVSS